MDSSLSSVPPVWPRPRPEIIGTAPPHAATIGASRRLTLSPTPPVECLSRTGPDRPASDQSSTSPERVMAPVSATRSPRVIPRNTMAMARAPTWASVTEPSVIPATSSSISSRESSPPSRLRRMSSATSIGQPPDELQEKAAQIRRSKRGGLKRLIVGELDVAHPLGQVRDHRHRGHAQAAVAGDDRLGHGGHADGVRAERAVGPDLGGGLEARAGDLEVDPLGQIEAEVRRRAP